MSYVRYNHVRERERDPYDSTDAYYSRPLVRRNSKRQRADIYDSDDGFDDYPYSSSHKPATTSRALTVRQLPSQLEKYNVWSYTTPRHESRHHSDNDDDDRHSRRYKYTTTRYSTRPHSDDEDEDEREFRLKVKASLGRSKSSHSSDRKAMNWSGDMFRRRDKWEGIDWESRERERGDSFWDDDAFREKTVRYRKIKRTRTDEWKPLSGFRRF